MTEHNEKQSSAGEVVLPDTSDLRQIAAEASPAERQIASEHIIDELLLNDAARMIATVANNEAKTLTFAAMTLRGEGQALSKRQIYNHFLDIQGEDGPWTDIGHRVPGQYASDTFEPIGAVVKSREMGRQGPSDHFTVTHYGERIGLAFSGMMLDLSIRYPEVSLYEMFSKTGTASETGVRGPANRLKIIQTLTQLEPGRTISSTNLSYEADQHHSIAVGHVRDLEAIGIIETKRMQRRESDKAITIIQPENFTNMDLRPWKGQTPTLVHEYIQNSLEKTGEPARIEDLIDFVKEHTPDRSEEWIREQTHYIVRQWELAGLLQAHSEFSNEQRTYIKINPNSLEMVQELILAVQAIMEGDQSYLDWGEDRAREILNDPQLVNQLLLKGREASPYANRESTADFEERVLGLLSDGEKNANQLTAGVESQGKPISRASVQRITRSLLEKGKIEAVKKAGVSFYRTK